MKFDIDRFREILDTLSRNKSRSFLTGFGVFWGVFMLVALLGGGQGLKELLQNNFEGFATNSAIIFAQPTTKPYAGFRKERKWSMVYSDVERLKRQVPELETVSPVDNKVSISRGSGLSLTDLASLIKSSVDLPIADTTATTLLPARLHSTMRWATCMIRSGEATEVPPNFITIVDMPAIIANHAARVEGNVINGQAICHAGFPNVT